MSTFKAALEARLLNLEPRAADEWQLMLREGRGAWLLQLRQAAGKLLFLGDSRSGAISALALQGYEVWVHEECDAAWAFTASRAQEHTPGRVQRYTSAQAPRFDLVVCEQGHEALLPEGVDQVWLVDNRLGYKRSLASKGEFRVPSPWEYARWALWAPAGSHSLIGYRAALQARGYASVDAYALYPHREDFSHVVALDSAYPALTIGPMERKNRLKLWGARCGLFPWLAPSFALLAHRSDHARSPTRLEAALETIAAQLGTPTPSVETIIATRGNSAVVHTREPAWTLHVPLAPKNFPQTARHFAQLLHLEQHFPQFPAPRALLHGSFAGLSCSVETRLAGWSAAQACTDPARRARMLNESAQALSLLVVSPAQRIDDALFEEQIAARVRLVQAHAVVPSTCAWLERLLSETWQRVRGLEMPLVFYHADLRAKHVQVDAQGAVLGVLDWGTAEARGLPYYDLLQLLAHEIKQEHQLSIGAAWRRLMAGELRGYERGALDRYREALGLDPRLCEAIVGLYPALVAAMAEKNWDYSRPRWLHRQFEL